MGGDHRPRSGRALELVAVCSALAVLGGACGAEDTGAGRPRQGSGTTGMFANAQTGASAPGAFGNPGAGTAGGAAPLGGAAGSQGSCAQGTANAAPVTPTVWLVIDGSGSMDESFNGPTRWEALRSALMDPGGLVDTLQSAARFGMVIYNGPENGGSQCNAPERINPLCLCFTGLEPFCCDAACGGSAPPPPADPAQCANLVVVDPALDNFAVIDGAYPAQEIGGWTPTDRAIEHVVANLPVLNEQQLDTEGDPVYVILATDGAPNDNCAGSGLGGGGSGFVPEVAQRVLDAVTAGAQRGMRMFVISLAGDDPQLGMHLAQVAQAGNTGQPPFAPSTKDDLVAALQQIIGGATCQITLDGTVQSGQHCAGEVTLNGFALECDAADGWHLLDDRTVQLTGSACESFLTTPSQVHADFPCGVFTPD